MIDGFKAKANTNLNEIWSNSLFDFLLQVSTSTDEIQRTNGLSQVIKRYIYNLNKILLHFLFHKLKMS